MVNSASDERIVNNVMRHEYRVLSAKEKADMLHIKDLGFGFHTFLDTVGKSAELTIAQRKIQEAVMWAVNHVTK